jgi:hypothetical protein
MKSARPSTAKTSRSRSFAFDPRLLIGLALVVASIAGVIGIIRAADESVQVYAARGPLSPGDRVDVNDLEVRSVRLDLSAPLYLAPGDVPPSGLVVTRSVSDGELVPASAIGSVDGLRLTSLVLSVDSQLSASVKPGTVVDLWASREVENGQFGPPVVIVSGATVVRLVTSQSIVAGGETTAVEILVPKSKVARILEAVANDDSLSIVPANIPGRI